METPIPYKYAARQGRDFTFGCADGHGQGSRRGSHVYEVNVAYNDRHIPLQINHMSDIIPYNDSDFSTVNSERIFLLCKLQYSNAHDLCNGYMH
jgi:hypothetical protein